MGSIYRRGDSPFWWLSFIDASGRRRAVSSESQEESVARKLLAAVERKVQAEKESGLAAAGPVTVERYARKWLEERRERGVASAADDEGRLRHALPRIGHMVLADVRPRHIRDLLRDLTTKGELAPRTVHHVYAALRVMFSDAVTEELLSATPCTLRERRGELPPKRDQDPLWRASAVYTREEVEALISDGRVPEDRRVLYALIFCGGTRVGEAAALRWSRYERHLEPLGRLVIAKSFSHRTKEEKGVKTDNPREMPVHPVLAKVLERWWREGWERMCGRAPSAEDLIIPSREGRHRRATHVLRRLHYDLEQLGFRARRAHDARRTFISLAQADGAQPHILKWVTHGPPRGIISAYTTLPWSTLCGEVAKLQIQLTEEEAAMQEAACYAVSTQDEGQEKAPKFQELGGHSQRGVRDLNPWPPA